MKTQSFQGGKHGTNSAIQGGVDRTDNQKILFRFEQEIRRRCTRKEMKQSFETKITIRIYDTAFANELDEAYVASGERFESKNHFLTSLIRIGLERYILEQKVKAEGSHTTDADKTIAEIKKLLDEFIKYSRKQAEITTAHHEVCEKLAASILAIVLALSQNEDVDKDEVLDGVFENLSDRLEQIILQAKFR